MLEQETLYGSPPPLNPTLLTGSFEDFSQKDGIDTADIADSYLRARSTYQQDTVDRISPIAEPQEVQIMSGLGKDSSLEKTDWNSELEMTTLFKNYNNYISEGRSASLALELSFLEVEQDIRTFTLEFIQAKLVIPFLVSLDASAEHSIVSRYDNRSVVSKTSSEERFGANLDAAKTIDEFMRTAPANSLAILNSPPGWTGWFDSQGKPITYTDNQMTVYWKEEGDVLNALTIVSDLNYEQSKQYSTEFGVDKTKLEGDTDQEKVANLVRNPILLSFPKDGQSPVERAVEKLLAIRGLGDIKVQKKDGTFESKPVTELIEGIARREDMLNFCEEVEQVILQLKEYLFSKLDNLGDFNTQKTISSVVDRAILEITRINRKDSSQEGKVTKSSGTVHFKSSSSKVESYTHKSSYTPQIAEWMSRDYGGEIAYLENQKGCAGGSRVGVGSFSIRSFSAGSFSFSSSSSSKEFGVCGQCGGNSADNHYHCPDCSRKFADETNVSPDSRTKGCKCGFKFGC